MRTWGRTQNPDGSQSWVEVTTTPTGLNDYVYLTTLAQVLKLNLGESPFYANYGIPAVQSVLTQIFPDFYVAMTQKQFAQYFASLIISKRSGPDPIYDVRVTTQQGVVLNAKVPIPT